MTNVYNFHVLTAMIQTFNADQRIIQPIPALAHLASLPSLS
jgi:hypothetical protein